MYDTSEDAIEANEGVTLKAAQAELARHGCRVLATLTEAPFGGNPEKIQVTNDIDEPEWIECTTAAILIWLGY